MRYGGIRNAVVVNNNLRQFMKIDIKQNWMMRAYFYHQVKTESIKPCMVFVEGIFTVLSVCTAVFRFA